MTEHSKALSDLIAKEEIRELVLLYSRGVDRKDPALLRDLYTADATDTHGDTFDGSAEDYVTFLESAFPHMQFSAHNIGNHLISVDGDQGEGEVYGVAYHIFADGKGGWIEDMMCVRYLDHYRKEPDGRWRFAKRVVSYDMRSQRPVDSIQNVAEHSYDLLRSSLFSRGARD